jgi:glycolate oxidase iron-sulfur subunit
MIDMLPPPRRNEGPLPEFLPAIGRRRATVGLFVGCIGDAMFRHVNWATARVLQQNGCDVHVPRSQVCCGAIHFHGAASEPAREFADRNRAAFPLRRFDAVVNNIAGCGSMLKDYGHHWQDAEQADRAAWSGQVRDVNEFLDELGVVRPEGEVRAVATYHDACHLLHAQKIRDAPRRLLAQIPGLELRDLAETEVCCGAAGTYNLTEPEMSARLSRRKLQNIMQTGAQMAITSNAGCALQIAREARQQGLQLAVVHPMEVLDLSYRKETPRW